MKARTLKVTSNPDWRGSLRTAAHGAFAADTYQGETLNFESPAAFFSRLTEKRWEMLYALQGAGEVARRLERDVKRVHEDAGALVDLGLVERTERGGLVCPFDDIHVDMHLKRAAQATWQLHDRRRARPGVVASLLCEQLESINPFRP